MDRCHRNRVFQLLSLLSATGCAAGPEPPDEDVGDAKEPIRAGYTHLANQPPWSCELVAIYHKQNFVPTPGAATTYDWFPRPCSGTMLNPGWVITAKHCTQATSFGPVIPSSDLRVIGGPNPGLAPPPAGAHTVAGIRWAPNEADVALIRLDPLVDTGCSYPSLNTSPVLSDQTVALFGYGRNTPGTPPLPEPPEYGAGVLRHALFTTYAQKSGLFEYWTELGQSSQNGDSGGPTFRAYRATDGTYRIDNVLVGVHMDPNRGTLVSPIASWVFNTAMANRSRQVLGRQPDGVMRMYEADGYGGWALGTGQVIEGDWGMYDIVVGTNDFSGDGLPDVLARKPDGTLWLYSGDGAGGWLSDSGQHVGAGWNMYDRLVAPGDFTGDGLADVLGRKPDGTLWLYSGNGVGGWIGSSGQHIGAGWSMFDLILAPGDFTGDGLADILARKPDGTLWLYRGNGIGGWLTGVGERIGEGWEMFDAIVAPGDFTGDWRPDLMGRLPNGDLLLYPGNGSGSWQLEYGWVVGRGWNMYDTVLSR